MQFLGFRDLTRPMRPDHSRWDLSHTTRLKPTLSSFPDPNNPDTTRPTLKRTDQNWSEIGRLDIPSRQNENWKESTIATWPEICNRNVPEQTWKKLTKFFWLDCEVFWVIGVRSVSTVAQFFLSWHKYGRLTVKKQLYNSYRWYTVNNYMFRPPYWPSSVRIPSWYKVTMQYTMRILCLLQPASSW